MTSKIHLISSILRLKKLHPPTVVGHLVCVCYTPSTNQTIKALKKQSFVFVIHMKCKQHNKVYHSAKEIINLYLIIDYVYKKDVSILHICFNILSNNQNVGNDLFLFSFCKICFGACMPLLIGKEIGRAMARCKDRRDQDSNPRHTVRHQSLELS